jgi:hypothetical protein
MEGGFNKVSKSGSPVWAYQSAKYSHFCVAYLSKKSLAAVMAARDLFLRMCAYPVCAYSFTRRFTTL